jgi:hypothetical protein
VPIGAAFRYMTGESSLCTGLHAQHTSASAMPHADPCVATPIAL